MNSAAPGWYPDPHDPLRRRYWTGNAWTDHPPPPAPQWVVPSQPKHHDPKRKWWILLIVVVFVVVGAVSIAMENGVFKSDEEKEHDASIENCESVVRGLLKAPTTAKFDQVWTIRGDLSNFGSTDLGGSFDPSTASSVWVVRGSVTSQNPYGVPLNNSFECAAFFSGGQTLHTYAQFEQ